ncbi:hypothetical protein EV11_0628 [Prochlorococcus sp. SS52]|nr:hypothetical protein EV04_1297 [Prochlorococcus marinus str. LG]KGG21559.1 hypothetical protein EV08_0648 [Prochlorococcus marinus str. SS2]KGG23098.1 hypothetical protein EV09_1843 [Prochlorococcus marinus str. SS35]KGG33807.1 hypothetical protein EV10_0244 [Prochlorococcus marinus str. SS51]KGG36844.1 hypothetical protein EV11_0628 [Prochlorococcus sp. SS52]
MQALPKRFITSSISASIARYSLSDKGKDCCSKYPHIICKYMLLPLTKSLNSYLTPHLLRRNPITSSTFNGEDALPEMELASKSTKSYLDPYFFKQESTFTGHNGNNYELCEHLA